MNVPAAGTTRGREALLLGAVLLLGVALRLVGLSTLPWDQDELYTLRDASDLGARASAGGLPGIAARPVYYLLQHALLQVAEPTPLMLRAMPFVFGVLGVLATWVLARRLFGTTAAAAAALLVAVAPWHLYASQFARYWTLVYLVAALVLLLLPRALQANRTSPLLAAAALLALGALTHPTFVFPMVGVVAALHLWDADGRFGLQWPTRRAWLGLWAPLLLGVGGYLLYLKLAGPAGAVGNGGGRGLAASMRVLPGVVQWLTPVMTTAALAGGLALLLSGRGPDRRWGGVILLGLGSAAVLLGLSATQTDVYADYAMAALPLAFLGAGAGVQRLAERVPRRPGAVAVALAAVLLSGVLPGTVSHLSDGTRFDYRPAYAWLLANAPDAAVFGSPVAQQRAYGPGLRFREFDGGATQLDSALAAEGHLWAVASYHRRGLISGGWELRDWLRAHCRARLVTERPRLDYRTYRVELLECGPDGLRRHPEEAVP